MAGHCFTALRTDNAAPVVAAAAADDTNSLEHQTHFTESGCLCQHSFLEYFAKLHSTVIQSFTTLLICVLENESRRYGPEVAAIKWASGKI